VWKFRALLGIGPAATVVRDRPGTPQLVLNQLFGWRSFAAGLASGVCEGAVPRARCGPARRRRAATQFHSACVRGMQDAVVAANSADSRARAGRLLVNVVSSAT
jgi:hypothetical protein